MEEEKLELQGGSLEKSLSGQTKIDLKAIAHEAWNLSKNGKREVLQGALLVVFVAVLLIGLVQAIFGVEDMTLAPPRMQMTLQILFIIFTAPIIAAMLLLGMSRSVGAKPAFMPVLRQTIGSALIIVIALLVAILTDIGMKLLFFPGLYLALSTGFSLMLLVEKKLPPSQAIIQSIKVFNRYWAPLSIFYIGSFVCLFIGILSFGVAYIWLIPFYINFKGVLYRELFGVLVAKSKKNNQTEESVFHA